MPRKRNSLKHDLFIAASKNITNNRTRTSYKRAITRFTKWAKEHNIKKISDITEEVIADYLYTESLPRILRDPDLIIRTSGEIRLSNFLPWQAAYSELYFTDVMWPDFGEEALRSAIVEYSHRHRRFGGV